MGEGSFEAILKRMLERVSSSTDKREGAVIYDALAPAAVELQLADIRAGAMFEETFAVKAGREALVKKAAEFGIAPNPATKALVLGMFDPEAPIGGRFNLEELNYKVLSRQGEKAWLLECETPGKAGNKVGTLTPIDYISGLRSAEATEIAEEGLDEEDTESFRRRFLFQLQRPVSSGNAYHYWQWALETGAVSDALVLPLHDGPGTVKVLVVDQDRLPADEDLQEKVRAHIEEARPIGAKVTVGAPGMVSVNVAAVVTLAQGAVLETVRQGFQAAAGEYLCEHIFQKPYISNAQMGSLLLKTEGVLDYTELTLNGGAGNIPIPSGSIPVLGAVSLEV